MDIPQVEKKSYLKKDRQGNTYYSLMEALNVLGIGRTTFEMLRREYKIVPFKARNDRKYYYRVEDIKSLQQEDDELLPVDGKV